MLSVNDRELPIGDLKPGHVVTGFVVPTTGNRSGLRTEVTVHETRRDGSVVDGELQVEIVPQQPGAESVWSNGCTHVLVRGR